MKKIKMAVLTMLCAGALYGTSCGPTDIKNNVIAGTLGFVKNYTTAFFTSWIPSWEEAWDQTP